MPESRYNEMIAELVYHRSSQHTDQQQRSGPIPQLNDHNNMPTPPVIHQRGGPHPPANPDTDNNWREDNHQPDAPPPRPDSRESHRTRQEQRRHTNQNGSQRRLRQSRHYTRTDHKRRHISLQPPTLDIPLFPASGQPLPYFQTPLPYQQFPHYFQQPTQINQGGQLGSSWNPGGPLPTNPDFLPPYYVPQGDPQARNHFAAAFGSHISDADESEEFQDEQQPLRTQYAQQRFHPRNP
ncbi:unnamed protein product [Orchesella dallaii]|uniref:Uncharacterized protein n=1 Tax=Orchesella dallaii TaxID=48710 RepID=A0ABP1RUE2_9HEXA